MIVCVGQWRGGGTNVSYKVRLYEENSWRIGGIGEGGSGVQ